MRKKNHKNKKERCNRDDNNSVQGIGCDPKENRKQPREEITIWCSNVDVYTQEKYLELKNRIPSNKPDIIALSEVKPTNYKLEVTMEQFNLDDYNMEHININCNNGRGLIVYVNKHVKYNGVSSHYFHLDINESLLIEISLVKGKIFCSILCKEAEAFCS